MPAGSNQTARPTIEMVGLLLVAKATLSQLPSTARYFDALRQTCKQKKKKM
jgi:hypothetical protein